ncbi:hypothetical protein [Cryptosporangium sp. NPDC051539]|uniref:hypothetical protein n=1 Tax=Cryptosporangium sp. NPDC051539 TaxID=3363962 RepID=UPI0037B1DFBE
MTDPPGPPPHHPGQPDYGDRSWHHGPPGQPTPDPDHPGTGPSVYGPSVYGTHGQTGPSGAGPAGFGGHGPEGGADAGRPERSRRLRRSGGAAPGLVTTPSIPVLVGARRDTAVVALAAATALLIALAVALSLLLYRARTGDDALASARTTPTPHPAAQSVQPGDEPPAAAAVEPEASAQAQETAAEHASAEATTDPDAAAAATEHAAATASAEATTEASAEATTEAGHVTSTDHLDELALTGTDAPWVASAGLALTLSGFVLVRTFRRRFPLFAADVPPTLDEIVAFIRRREPEPVESARRLTPADQSVRLTRVASRAARGAPRG